MAHVSKFRCDGCGKEVSAGMGAWLELKVEMMDPVTYADLAAIGVDPNTTYTFDSMDCIKRFVEEL